MTLSVLLKAHEDGLGGESMSQRGGGGCLWGYLSDKRSLCPMRQGGGSMCQTRGYVSFLTQTSVVDNVFHLSFCQLSPKKCFLVAKLLSRDVEYLQELISEMGKCIMRALSICFLTSSYF